MNAFRRSITTLSLLVSWVAAALVYVAASPAAPASAAIPTDISGMTVTPVLSGLPLTPVAAEFSPDGRIYVAVKEGKVLMYDGPGDSTPVTTLDIQTDTQDFHDRGLLGLALDPAFTGGRPYLYVLYTYDRDPFGSTTVPRWGDTCPVPPGETTDGCTVSARLDRYSVGASGVVTGSPTRLLDGVGGSLGGWCNQFPSHSIGTLAFGADNMLYVGSGDGASYNYADYGQSGGTLSGTPTPANPCNDKQGTSTHTGGRGTALGASTSRGGAVRSQAVRGAFNNEYVSWDGAILRINPDTGAAAAGNPLLNNGINGDDRIIAYGLRNPFRFNLKPGTNQLWLGDVGWNAYEEIDRFDAGPTQTTVPNFGWPCYEGPGRMGAYDGLNISLCETLYSSNTSSLGGVSSPLVAPTYSWTRINNSGSLPCGAAASGGGGASVGGSFVANSQWPSSLQGAYVFGDYARQCIALIPMVNGSPDVANVRSIVSGVFPVDIQTGPGGDVYWIDIANNTMNRIRPVAGNLAPIASFTATPSSGAVPLNVAFNASATTDPNQGEVLTYTWDLDGDGLCDDGSGITINRTYSTAATITIKLCVADQLGATNTTTRQIQPGNTAPVITSFTTSADTNGWKVGDNITFSANATDNAGTLPTSAYTWKLDLRHCTSEAQTGCHTHPETAPPAGKTGSFGAPDHEYYAYLQLTLTVTDSSGLTATQVKDLLPRVSTVVLQTSPAGIGVSAGSASGVSPLTAKFLENGAVQLVVPATAVVGGATQTFVAWADNASAPATRTVNAPAGSTTYTAKYDGQAPGVASVAANPASLDLRTGSSVVVTANLTDDVGVASAVARLSGPNSTVYSVVMTRTGGSAASGPWSGTVVVPSNAPLGSYALSVTATDGLGKTGTGSGSAVNVSKSAVPVITALTTSADANGWKVGDAIAFQATATDNQGTLPAGAYAWTLKVHHCNAPGGSTCDDTALTSPPNGASGSFVAPDWADYPVLVLTLTVTDNEGLTATRSVTLAPRMSNVTVQSQTAGVTVKAGTVTGTTTATARVVEAGAVQLIVPATAVVGGTTHVFIGWVDNASAPATRTVNAPAGSTTYTAKYDGQAPGVASVAASPASLDLRTGSSVVVTANLTDDVGVASAVARLSGPNSTVYSVVMTRTGGSAASGPWSGTVVVPSNAPLGSYALSVTATDGVAKTTTGSGTAVPITKSAVPVITALTTSADANGWKVGDAITFQASVSDNEGALPASAYAWTLTLHHCNAPGGSTCDDQPLPSPPKGSTGAFVAPDWADYPVLVLTLTVTDGEGLTATRSVTLTPRMSDVSVASQPAGVDVTAGDVTGSTTATARVVEAGAVVLAVPTTATIGGVAYTFDRWADDPSAPATRTIAAPAGHSTFIALYSSDTQPPKVVSATAGPNRLDSRNDGTITVSATLTDNTSVVAAVAHAVGADLVVHSAPLALQADGTWAGNVELPLNSPPGDYAVTVDATDAAGNTGSGSANSVLVVWTLVEPPLTGDRPVGFTAITPHRVLDTRNGTGAPADPLSPGNVLRLQVAGTPGIDPAATGVVVNVAAVDAGGAGYVTVFPCGAVPVVSNLNLQAAQTSANLAIVDLDPSGAICFVGSQTTDLIADVTAVIVPGGAGYSGIAPVRVVDTRNGTGLAAAALAPGEIVEIPLEAASIPLDAAGVVANLTVTEPDGAGYLSAFPCAGAAPLASNVNFRAGQTVSNLVVTALDADQRLCVTTNATIHLVVDVSGWLTSAGGSPQLVTPFRALDSRATASLSAGQTLHLGTAGLRVPADASAVIANVTAVDPAAAGYLTVAPCEAGGDATSNVNYDAGETRPVLTMTTLGPSRTVCVHASQPMDVVVDVQGYIVAS